MPSKPGDALSTCRNLMDWRAIQGALTKAKGRRILFVDACHSGGAYNTTLSRDAQLERFVALAATASAGSAAGTPVALEDDKVRHGYFTFAAIDGLKGKAEDSEEHVVRAYRPRGLYRRGGARALQKPPAARVQLRPRRYCAGRALDKNCPEAGHGAGSLPITIQFFSSRFVLNSSAAGKAAIVIWATFETCFAGSVMLRAPLLSIPSFRFAIGKQAFEARPVKRTLTSGSHPERRFGFAVRKPRHPTPGLFLRGQPQVSASSTHRAREAAIIRERKIAFSKAPPAGHSKGHSGVLRSRPRAPFR